MPNRLTVVVYNKSICPCGFYGDPIKECSCSASFIARYQKRISGPLLDPIDIHLEAPRVDYEKLADKRNAESSARRDSPFSPTTT